MGIQKKKLITLFAVEIVLIIIHRLLDQPPKNIEAWHLEAGWHYWLAMGFGIYVFYYILSSRCPNCHKPQIYRGAHPSLWYWPPDLCWYCKTDLVNKK